MMTWDYIGRDQGAGVGSFVDWVAGFAIGLVWVDISLYTLFVYFLGKEL
jgi:tetrahydromethanopterin S-methyltransferase subunit F